MIRSTIFKRLTLLCLIIAFFAFNIKAQTVNYPYINPTPGEICIIAVSPIPSNQSPTRQAYKWVEDCGFNMMVVNGSNDYIKQQFSLSDHTNLKLMVRGNDFTNANYKKCIDLFKNHKRLGCWNLWDEPKYEDLSKIKGYYDKIYSADKNHMVFINLIGAINKMFTGPSADYPSYLNTIQNYFKPAVWSYDLYPLSKSKGKVVANYDLFYSDFEAFRKQSDKTGRPFWAFCQSIGFKNSAVERPVPTLAYLRFEAFSALAYGAQGIIYWTYAQRTSYNNETFYSALVDLNGKKTSAWSAAQKVNSEIKKFNNVFVGCKVLEVKHTGNNLYKSTTRLSGKFGPFNSVKSGNSGVLASRISNNNKEYIIFVNHDFDATQSVSLELQKDKKILFLTANNQSGTESTSISFQLDKGGYAIIQVLQ